MILFPRPRHRVDLTRAFISLRPEDTAPAPSAVVDPKRALLDLGILLLEIWHKKSLESRFSLPEPPVEYYERLTLGLKWLDDVEDPLPELYDKAVSYCIVGILNAEARVQSWEDARFGDAVCGNVIEPLSRSCKQWVEGV